MTYFWQNPYGRRRRWRRPPAREPEYIYQKWWVIHLFDAAGERFETYGMMGSEFRTEESARESLERWKARYPKEAAKVAREDIHQITIRLDPARMP